MSAAEAAKEPASASESIGQRRYRMRRSMEWCPPAGTERNVGRKYSFAGLLAEAKKSSRGAVVRRESLEAQLRREGRLDDDGSLGSPKPTSPRDDTARARKMRDLFHADDDDLEDDDGPDEELFPPPKPTPEEKMDTEHLSDAELADLGKRLLKSPPKAKSDDARVDDVRIDDVRIDDAALHVASEEHDDDAILAEPPPWRRNRTRDATPAKKKNFHSVADARKAEQGTSYVTSVVEAARAAWYGTPPAESATAEAELTAASSSATTTKKKKKKKNKNEKTSSLT